jgi:hypothetical membrane protein
VNPTAGAADVITRVAAPGRVPWWGVVSAVLAPVFMIGGWELAAAVQPVPFDAVVRTISDLAARDTPHRWVMTVGLAGLGLAHVVTAVALRAGAWAGRVLLALGGLATLVVSAAPLPAGGGSSTVHTAAATVGFVALSTWSLLAFPRWRTGWVGAAALVGLLLWFGVELGGPRFGLSERVLAGAQATWPLLVVTRLVVRARLVTGGSRGGSSAP